MLEISYYKRDGFGLASIISTLVNISGLNKFNTDDISGLGQVKCQDRIWVRFGLIQRVVWNSISLGLVLMKKIGPVILNIYVIVKFSCV